MTMSRFGHVAWSCLVLSPWAAFAAAADPGAPAPLPVPAAMAAPARLPTPAAKAIPVKKPDAAAVVPSKPGDPEKLPGSSWRQVVSLQQCERPEGSRVLGYGNCQWLEPREAPAERLIQQPTYRSERPIYYAARFGNGKDPVFTLVLDEGQGLGKGFDTIYIDIDNDNRIDPAKEKFAIPVGTPTHSTPLRIGLMVTAGDTTVPYYVSLTAFEYSDAKRPARSIHINLRDSSYYTGEAVFDGKSRKIALADLDCNGLFNDVEQGLFHGDRLFVDLDGDGQFGRQRGCQESFAYGKYTKIAGQWYTIIATPDGSRVDLGVATPPLGKVQASARVAAATLSSPSQPEELLFQRGFAEAVAGTYQVRQVRLLGEGEPAEGFSLTGSFPGLAPQLAVRQGEAVQLAAGLPLKVEPVVSSDDERTLRVCLQIRGAGGEVYRWASKTGSLPQAAFEIVDAQGQAIATEQIHSPEQRELVRLWRAPRTLNGEFEVIPNISLAGFEHQLVRHRIRLRNGELVEGGTPAEGTPAQPLPASDLAAVLRGELRALEGVWVPVSGTVQTYTGPPEAKIRLQIIGDRLTLETTERWQAKYTVDPTKYPKRIDLVITSPDGKKMEEAHGIYSLLGDELKLCLAFDDAPRPTSVQASPGTGQISMVLKRQETTSSAPKPAPRPRRAN